jgi:hypothetical protein
MKKILVIWCCLLTVFASCASPPFDEIEQGAVASCDYASWIGEYRFDENITRYDSWTGELKPPMTRRFIINIYEWEGKPYAYVAVDGWMTYGRLRTTVLHDENKTHLLYDEKMEGGDSYTGYEPGSLMLSFERRGEELITTWGRIRPMIVTNELPGVYFEFDPDAEFDASVHEDIDPVVIEG